MGDHISLAALLYTFALRISGNTGLFFCSGVQLAKYFDCNKDTIYAAIGLLEYMDFFLLVSAPPGKPKVYRVLGHSQWAEMNPGRCTVKIEHDDWMMECESIKADGSSSQGIDPTGAVGHSKQGLSGCSSQGGV
jgi:hypothetical protein